MAFFILWVRGSIWKSASVLAGDEEEGGREGGRLRIELVVGFLKLSKLIYNVYKAEPKRGKK